MAIAELSLSAPTVAFHGNAIASDPSVIFVNDEYLMFYTDLDYEGVRTAISVARSVDGENWTRIMAPGDAGGSVLSGAQSFETAEAAMIDGQLVLYVSEYDEAAANGLDAAIFAYRVNPDFSVEPFAPGPVISPAAGGADEDAAFSPTVFAHDGGYIMYYVGHDYFEADSTGVSLLSATSPDGVTWTPGTEPVLHAKDAPSWAIDGIAEPSVVIGPDERVHLFYTALQGEDRSIGHAVADHVGAAFDFAQGPLLTPADLPGNVMQILAPSAIVENGELSLWFFAYDASGGYSILNSSAAFGPEQSENSNETSVSLGNEHLPLGSGDIITVAEFLDDTPISGHQTANRFGGDDWIDAGLGSDAGDGGADVDMISFSNHSNAMAISLLEETAHPEPDTIPISTIENTTGNGYGDVLSGDANVNWLRALAGHDQFIATDGADTYEGFTSREMVTYINATAAVTVDLIQQRGQAEQAANHTYVDIERVRGAIFDDIFYGGADDDFFGGGREDMFYDSDGRDRYIGGGGQGNDRWLGYGGNDPLEGGIGDDVLNGGPGYDVALHRDVASHYFVATADDVTTDSHITEGIDALTGIEALAFADVFVYF